MFDAQWRRPLLVGVGLAVFQQITGINAIIYYADQIFEAAGFTSPAAQTTVTTWAVGGVNVVATFIAIAFIDRLGRRKLLLAGLLGMGLSLAVVGAAFELMPGAGTVTPAGTSAAGVVTLVSLIAFIACFAFSMGPVVWTVINEIFPGHIRGRAVAVATVLQLGGRVHRQPGVPFADRRDRQLGHLLAVRVVLRLGLDLDLSRRAGDEGPLARADPAAMGE